MNKYLKIFIELVKNNLIREMEFRANFLLWFGIQGLWVGLQILIVQILFQYTNSIDGWTKPEIFLLMGIFRTIRGVFDFFVYANLVGLPELVGKGDLDYILAKPVNSLFFLSLRRHQFSLLATFLSGVVFIVYSWDALKLPISLNNLVTLVLVLVIGFISLYSIMLLVSTLSFFFTRLSAISSFYDVINTVLRYPVNMLVGGQSQLLLIPLAIIVTVPAQIILGKPVIGGLMSESFALVVVFIALQFWNFAIKRYSSASS